MSLFIKSPRLPTKEELSRFEKQMRERLGSTKAARLVTEAYKNGAQFVDFSERDNLATPEEKFLWDVRNGQLPTFQMRFGVACRLGIDLSKFDRATLDSLQLGIIAQ